MDNYSSEIVSIEAYEILDSRGNPTVKAAVTLASGAIGKASVPSGASTGSHEAFELRDKSSKRYGGRGVLGAVENVNTEIAPALVGISALDQQRADSIMIALDGTHNKSKLGANAILSVSIAIARAAAEHLGIPLYRYAGGALRSVMPIPMMNVINGGAHSDNGLDVQEFMIVPIGAESFAEALRMGAETYAALRGCLSQRGLSVALGDEGGFAPRISDEREALDMLLEAIKKAGYRAGEDIALALDVAATEWFRSDTGDYLLPKSERSYGTGELVSLLESLARDYPIISIEDGCAEDDISGWVSLTERLSGIALVGDDLFVTSRERVELGAEKHIANSVLIKPNQIGTVSEVAETVAYAHSKGYRTVMSHRSGETSDTSIADIAVALGCGMIKSGATARAERVAKYNRLLEIEAEIFSPTIARYC